MSQRRRKANAKVRPANARRPLTTVEQLTVGLLLCLLVVGLAQVVAYYPSFFFPRFADEGIYAAEAERPLAVFDAYDRSMARYAPAKLGYGLPLAAASALFGHNGPMYLSTFFWAMTILLLGMVAWRRLGRVGAIAAVAFVSFSPMFGKYIADVGPTTQVALGFVLLWAAQRRRQFWLSGLCIFFLAFTDFKWAIPAGVAYIALELLTEHSRTWRDRASHVLLTGLVAAGGLGGAMILHPPYAQHWYAYASSHSALMGFDPSSIVVYYWLLFGALPALIATTVLFVIPAFRRRFASLDHQTKRSVVQALILAAVPILFTSLFGVHKALRFFAVVFPLLAIPVGAAVSVTGEWVAERSRAMGVFMSRALVMAAPVAIVLLLWGGSDGPARHLALPAGYEAALDELRTVATEDGTVSSYNYAVVLYGWYTTATHPSFAYLGLHESDRWLALDPMLDRVTITLRSQLAGDPRDPDSIWMEQRVPLLSVSDSLYSVPSDYYASDYFLSEMVTGGIGVMRRWQASRSANRNMLTMYAINELRFSAHRTRLP